MRKTYAPSPVWKGSVRSEVQFQPIARRNASRLFHKARSFERQTLRRRVDAFGKVHVQGDVTRMGLLVLHTLLFDFLNYGSGRLDPSYQAIAHKACISARSAARGLAALKAAGVLNWMRRCTGRMEEGRYTLDQDTNAYAVASTGAWKGFRDDPPPPRPGPDEWGAAPPAPPPISLQEAWAVLARVRDRQPPSR